MLYNSYAFVCCFLPVVLAMHFGLFARFGLKWALGWMAAASLAFYAYWKPTDVLLIIGSILANYLVGLALSRSFDPDHPSARRRAVATLAVVANLGLLSYFKYLYFFSEIAASVFPVHLQAAQLVLPLGISFFTFEQVGYIVDAYRGRARDYAFVEYVFFVTFFPHLIAGPIIVHSDLLGQVTDTKRLRWQPENVACGLTLFAMGLAKKILLADPIAAHAAGPFAQAAAGAVPPAAEAWLGVMAYTLQLYFDFSGYSDMGLGLARLFNFKLPLNFDSPYKARNIIDFWRRWHMTLSRFLRDMLYIPLGGNRHGTWRRHLNLFITMVLGGLWHGAGWNFLAWGALHGGYLVVNHTWVGYRQRRWPTPLMGPVAGRLVGELSVQFTFLMVMIGWVFFRASSFAAATRLLQGMAGLAGGVGPGGLAPLAHGAAWVGVGYLVARTCPNSHSWLAPHGPALPTVAPTGRWVWAWRPSWALVTAGLLSASFLGFTHVSEFLYFQF